MPSNFRANDPYVNEQVDLDDVFISDAWLVDQFVGGTLFTWGYDAYGQLGNGNTLHASSPIQIGSLTNWKQVSCGYSHTQAIKTDGTLWSWGGGVLSQLKGQLGNGTTLQYSSPIQIGSLTNWKQVSGGYYNSAAIKNDGTLWVWGNNPSGQFGNGTTTPYSSPIQVGSLSNWKQVNIRRCLIALKTDGTMWSCGYNNYGGLGNGTTINYSSPVQIGSLTDWKQISSDVVNGYNSAAIKTDGTLWTWGHNLYGQLGLGNIDAVGNFTTTNTSSPVLVAGGATWANTDPDTQLLTISTGGNAGWMASIKTDGTLWACGYNSYGQLGNETTLQYSSPIQIGSLTNWKQVAIGEGAIGAVKTDGTLWMWGRNGTGKIGNGTTIHYSSPIQIGSLTTWKQISIGADHTVMIKTDGTLWGCGYNTRGEMGNGASGAGNQYSSPIQIGALTTWSKVACNNGFNAAIKTDGTLWTWGHNSDGQLGNNTTSTSYSSPIQVGSLTNWKQVSCGEYRMMAVKTDGTLWGWGSNSSGQLGNGTTISYNSPVQIGSSTNWKQVSAARNNTVAVKTDGTLWTSGYNAEGELGNGTTLKYSSPIQIGSLTTWSQVYATSQAVYGYTTDNKLYAWGANVYGQLGAFTNFIKNISSPVQIGSSTNWKQVSIGAGYSAAIKTDGTLWMWGRNFRGLLLNGTTVNYSSPIQVGSLTYWKQVSAGNLFCGAIKTDGTLWAWGYNPYGQLGNGVTLDYSSPIQIGSLTNWKQVDLGYFQSSAITYTDLG